MKKIMILMILILALIFPVTGYSKENLKKVVFIDNLTKSGWDYQTFKKVIGPPKYVSCGFDVYPDQGFMINNALGNSDRYNFIAGLNNNKFKKLDSKIVNVVFTDSYKDNIVGDISINSLKSDIIKKLGTPNFEDTDKGVYGYKLNDFYIFFIGKEKVTEVSIYKADKYNKDILQDIADNKLSNAEISPEIINSWGLPDKYRSDHGGFEWAYLSRGLYCEGENDCHPQDAKIVVYGNYTGKSQDAKRFEYKPDKDFVFEEELSRLQDQKIYQDKLKKGELSIDKSKVLFSNGLCENFNSNDKNLYIAWKNTNDVWEIQNGDNNPIYGYKWLNHKQFILITRFNVSVGATDTKKINNIIDIRELTNLDEEICGFDEKTNVISIYSNKLQRVNKKIILKLSKNGDLLNKQQVISELKNKH